MKLGGVRSLNGPGKHRLMRLGSLDGLHRAVAEGSVVEVLLAKSSLVGVGPDTVMMTW
jgi:hypothetical protein